MAAPTLVDNCMANWLILPFWADRLMFAQSPGLLSQHPKDLYSHQLPAHSVLLPPSLDHHSHPVPSRLPTPGQQKWDHPKAQDEAPIGDFGAGEGPRGRLHSHPPPLTPTTTMPLLDRGSRCPEGKGLARGSHLLSAPYMGDAWPRSTLHSWKIDITSPAGSPRSGHAGICVGSPNNGLRDLRRSQGIRR